jgi:hypothetical protein
MLDKDIELFMSKAYTKETTLKNYMHRLYHLRDKIIQVKDIYTIISTPETSYQKIKTAYPNISTRKNVLTVILSLFKNSEKLRESLKKEQAKWKEYHDHMDSFQEAKYKKHAPDMKQLSKYVPYEDIETKYKELKGESPHESMQTSLQYILLSIIISTPPKRSDYGQMEIYYDKDPNKKDINYIVLLSDSRPSYMVFNKYKTSKKYERVDQDLPISATKDIKDSIRRYPRKYLFINNKGEPYKTNDGFSKYVIRVFTRLFGKKTGVTMLRHIFITEKVSFDDMDEDEREDIAQQMLHSGKLQYKYNWSKKAICNTLRKLCKDCQSPSAKKSGDK